MDRFADFERGLRRDNPGIAGIDHLARQYGSRVREVLAIAQADPQHQMPVGPAGDIIAAVVHAAREEMAVTLTDAVVRRTGIGQLGPISRDSLVTAAAAMAIVHGWSRARQQSEIDAVSAALTLAGAPPTSGTNYPTRRH